MGAEAKGRSRIAQGQGEGLGFCSPYNEKSPQSLHLSLCSHFSFRKIVLDAGERAEKGAFKVSQLVDSRTIGWGREGGMGLPQAHALY